MNEQDCGAYGSMTVIILVINFFAFVYAFKFLVTQSATVALFIMLYSSCIAK